MSLTDAARQFPDIIRKVMTLGETIVLTEGTRPLVHVSPAGPTPTGADLAAIWPSLPHLDEEDAAAFEADVFSARQALPLPACPALN